MGDWGPLEIIIVLILVLALLGRVFGTGIGSKKVPDVATYKTEEKITPPPAFNDCGKMLVTLPKPSQKVSVTASGIPVQGTVKNCDVIPVSPDTFSIAVVDASAMVVSEPRAVPIAVSQGSISFSDYAVFTRMPRTGTGYVIITRVSNTGVQIPEGGARIPIRFVN